MLLSFYYISLMGLSLSLSFRSSHGRCSIKMAVLKIFAISTGKHLCRSLFLIKFQAFRPVFLWILRKFQEHTFWRTSANGCFYRFRINISCFIFNTLTTNASFRTNQLTGFYKNIACQWVKIFCNIRTARLLTIWT